MKFYVNIFRKSVKKIQASLKSDKNNRYFTRRRIYIYDYISLISSQEKKFFGQNLYRTIKKKQFMFNKYFPKKRTVCEIRRNNVVQPDRPQMTI